VVSGFLYFLALGVVLPVIPRYVKHELGGGSIAVGVAVGIMFVGAVLLRPFAGRVGDRSGRRVLIIGGAAIVGVSIALYGLADSLPYLLVARVLTGVGEGAFFVGAATMITDLAPVERRGEAISYWSVAVYLGFAFGPALGETILDWTNFTTTWLVSAGLAVAASVCGIFTVDVARPRARDRVAPLFHRGAMGPGAVLFAGLIGLASFNAFIPLYVGDVGLGGADLVFLLYGGLVLVIRVFGARLPDRLGGATAGTAALVTNAIGLLVIAGWATSAGLFSGTAVFAVGSSLLYPAMLLMALVGVNDDDRASAVGTVSSCFDLSQGIGALLVGAAASLTSYRGAFATGALASLVGLVALRMLVTRRAARARVGIATR
jgi:MFS family permease